MSDITGRLEGWFKYGRCIAGKVYEHASFPEGCMVKTSYITHAPELKEGKVVQTRNSRYLLGKPHEDSRHGDKI